MQLGTVIPTAGATAFATGVQATGALGLVNVWGQINDNQDANWENVSDAQDALWAIFNDNQLANWQNINDTQSPEWAAEGDTQIADWQEIAA
jgi:hypothetical protein